MDNENKDGNGTETEVLPVQGEGDQTEPEKVTEPTEPEKVTEPETVIHNSRRSAS